MMKFLQWYSVLLITFFELVWLATASTDDFILTAFVVFAPVTAWVWIVALKKQ